MLLVFLHLFTFRFFSSLSFSFSVAWYRGALSEFYTIFIYYFSVCFLWILFSFFISFRYFLVGIINLRIKLRPFFISIRFSWPFIEIIYYTHTHSRKLISICSFIHTHTHILGMNIAEIYIYDHIPILYILMQFARLQTREREKHRPNTKSKKQTNKKLCINVWRDAHKMTKLFISKIGNLRISSGCVYGVRASARSRAVPCWRWWTILPFVFTSISTSRCCLFLALVYTHFTPQFR